MEISDEEQFRIRHYFLNRLDETLNQQVEEKFMTSADYQTQMLIAEAELLEDYESGRLTASERASLEQRLQLAKTPPRELAAIRALRDYAQRQPPIPLTSVAPQPLQPSNNLFTRLALLFRSPLPAFAAIAILLAIGLAIWFFRIAPQRAEFARRQTLERESFRLNPALGAPLPAELSQPGAQLLPLTLSPELFRSSGATDQVTIKDERAIVQFQLNLPVTHFESYRFMLLEGDRELLDLDSLPPRTTNNATQLLVNLPAAALPPGNYRIKLSGRRTPGQLEEIADYSCQVVWPNLR